MSQLSLLEWTKPERLPAGFVRGSLPGSIAPTWGSHEGVPMYADSTIAHALMAARGAQ